MKKNVKKTLLVAPIACLALSLGAFAAACTPEEAGHKHHTKWEYDLDQHWEVCTDEDCPDKDKAPEKHDHDFNGANCECGATRTKTQRITMGDITVVGPTNAVYLDRVGTYTLTVQNVGEKSYTFALGSQNYTVDATHNTITFNITGNDSVEVYNPNPKPGETIESTERGVKFTITPAEDYSDGDTKDSLVISVVKDSATLTVGNNEDFPADGSLLNTFFVDTNFGEYTLHFDIADDSDDEYTVSMVGQTKTANKTNKSLTFNLSKDNVDFKDNDLNWYALTVTPKAGSAETVTCNVQQPKQVFNVNFGSAIGGVERGLSVAYFYNPEIIDYYGGVVDFKMTFPSDAAGKDFVLKGSTETNFELYVGDSEFPKVKFSDADGYTDFELDFTLAAADIVDGAVTFKLKLKDYDDSYGFSATIDYPKDNHTLSLVYDRTSGTVCSSKDIGADDKYIYTYEVKEAGWYSVQLYGGEHGISYKVGEETGNVPAWNWLNDDNYEYDPEDGFAVQLAAGDVLTVELTCDDEIDGAKIAILKTVAPKEYTPVSSGSPITAVGDYQVTLTESDQENGLSVTLNLTPGWYSITSLDKGEHFAVKFNETDLVYYDMTSWKYINLGKFEVSSSGSVTLVLNTDASDFGSATYKFVIAETTPDLPATTVTEGMELTQAGKYEVTIVKESPVATTPVHATFKPSVAGTYKITSLDESEYLTVKVNGSNAIYYGNNHYSLAVTEAGITLEFDGDMATAGTWQFTIELVES